MLTLFYCCQVEEIKSNHYFGQASPKSSHPKFFCYFQVLRKVKRQLRRAAEIENILLEPACII